MYRSSIERKHECVGVWPGGLEDVAQPGSSPPLLAVNGPFVQPQHRCTVVAAAALSVGTLWPSVEKLYRLRVQIIFQFLFK